MKNTTKHTQTKIRFIIKRALFFSVFYFLFSTLSWAQQIEFEKTWDFSPIDKNIRISNIIYNCIGNTIKDSLQHPELNWQNASEQQSIFNNNKIGDSISFRTYDDTIFNSIDLLLCKFSFINYSLNKSSILSGYWKHIATFTPSTQLEWDGSVMSIDSIGNINWFTYLNLYPLSDSKAITYSTTSVNGETFVVGQHQSQVGTKGDNFLSKVDVNGNLIFSRRYFISGLQVPWYSTLLSDGSLLLCGSSNSRAMFFKVNPINGDEISNHTSLTIPGADNSYLGVGYLEERSNHTYLSMVYDGGGQGYLCRLDTNFNLLSSQSTNSNFDNFFRVNDNEFVGYKQDAPVSVYAFDSLGAEKWNLQLTNPEYVNFTPDGNGGLMGAGNVEDNNGNSDFYLVRIDSVGYPAGPICNNPPQIQIATASVVGSNKSVNLAGEAIENLKYSDVIAYNWYFEDGNEQYGQYINYDFDEIQYPSSFWCMLVVTDAVGCTDTMTIDAYTGAIVFPNPNWPPLGIEEVKNNSASLIKPTIYPNPFTNEIRLKLNSSNVKSYSVSVYNVLGKIIHSSIELNNETTINLKTYPKGTYIIKLKTDDFIYSERIIKE